MFIIKYADSKEGDLFHLLFLFSLFLNFSKVVYSENLQKMQLYQLYQQY